MQRRRKDASSRSAYFTPLHPRSSQVCSLGGAEARRNLEAVQRPWLLFDELRVRRTADGNVWVSESLTNYGNGVAFDVLVGQESWHEEVGPPMLKRPEALFGTWVGPFDTRMPLAPGKSHTWESAIPRVVGRNAVEVVAIAATAFHSHADHPRVNQNAIPPYIAPTAPKTNAVRQSGGSM